MPRGKKVFRSPKGVYDILPDEQIYWEKVRQTVKRICEIYGFSRIDTPIIEEAQLFARSVGLSTDVVEKEMYSFKTKGKDNLVLRPEFTAGVVRAYIEHGMFNMTQPVKLYYLGPCFRYEQPQSGRNRQFYQFGFEIFGSQEPILDAEVIQVFFNICRELGLKNLIVHINSLGCSSCRPAYKKVLVNYYRPFIKKLCPDCQRRFKSNPLRLLDCKQNKCQIFINNAPQIIDYLCDSCHNHFKSVLEFLDELKIPYILDSHLVRGLDYYTRTVFEIFFTGGENKNEIEPVNKLLAIGGGGRFDNLVSLLGGRETPAIGIGGGIERIVDLMKKSKPVKSLVKSFPQVFLVQLGDLGKKRSLSLFEQLWRSGIKVAESVSKDSIKSQLKLANKMNVKLALILGQKEALDETIIVRDMRTGAQEVIPLKTIVREIKKRLKNK